MDNLDGERDGDFRRLGLTGLPLCLLDNKLSSNLTELLLDYNDIEILDSCIFSASLKLTVLSVIGNCLESLPLTVCEITTLKQLFLQENNIKYLPDSFHLLKSLETVNILGNSIHELPTNFGLLPNLKELYADENELLSLPDSFGKLAKLQLLELSDNQLEYLPMTFGELNCLQILNLSNNQLKDRLPDSFGELNRLVEVDLSCNRLKCLPSSFASHYCIKKFYCEENFLEILPEWMGNMPCLEEFAVKDNRLQGHPISEEFGIHNTSVKICEFGGNFIQSLPASLGNLQYMEKLHIGSVINELDRKAFQNGNWLTALPKSFPNLVSLKEANLNENQIGHLPHDFGNLINLEVLDLGQNQLRKIPDSFCRLSKLKWCQLSKNHLKELPENFGDLQSLNELRLDNNQIRILPDSMRTLALLHTLDLFNNCLEMVPPFLECLSALRYVDLDQNNLGLKWNEVPKMRMRAAYKPRDPNKKDNWRGKPRQDLIDLEVTKLAGTGPEEESQDCSDEEIQYSNYVLQQAMWRNLSLWKRHSDDPNATREKFNGHMGTESSDNDTGEIDEDDNDWEADDSWSRNMSQEEPQAAHSPQQSSDYPIKGTENGMGGSYSPTHAYMQSTENWDEELAEEAATNTTVNHCIPASAYGIPEDHFFIPSDTHTCSMNFSSLKEELQIMEGQFDDLDF